MKRKTRFAVLGVLSMEPASGYDIRKFLRQTVGHFWNESFGQIYPILRKLVSEGAVIASEEDGGKRPRTVYSITEAGEKQIHEWIENDSFEIRAERNELLLKIFFAGDSHGPAIIRQVERFQNRLLEQQKTYAAIRRELSHTVASLPGYSNWISTLRYGEITVKAQLAWCEEVLSSFLV